MREATGNALVMAMMTSIIAIIMIFFVGSISYSKSYRLKNYVINQLEEYGTLKPIEENGNLNSILQDNLDAYFKDVGYNVRRTDINTACPSINTGGNQCGNNIYKGSYEACIYKCGSATKPYYKVLTYMKFDFPVIGNSLKFKVEGETRTFNDFN